MSSYLATHCRYFGCCKRKTSATSSFFTQTCQKDPFKVKMVKMVSDPTTLQLTPIFKLENPIFGSLLTPIFRSAQKDCHRRPYIAVVLTVVHSSLKCVTKTYSIILLLLQLLRTTTILAKMFQTIRLDTR